METDVLHTDPAIDLPPAIDVINEAGSSDIVLICEHASNHMPQSYAKLGLPDPDLTRHIAWDIGAEAVARGLSKRLDAVCFLGTYSRLLIDLNRPVESPTSIPVRSEATDVPGNIGISGSDRQTRIDAMFTPFHERVAEYLDQRALDKRRTSIVAIHSFTPVFHGKTRPWHAGILYDRSKDYADSIIAHLANDPAMLIGANVPYIIDRLEDYAIPIHGEDRGHPAVLVEIRNDLLMSEAGIGEWIDRLADALTSAF